MATMLLFWHNILIGYKEPKPVPICFGGVRAIANFTNTSGCHSNEDIVMSSFNNRLNKHSRKHSPDEMNNVFFTAHGKLYCLHQWELAKDFALSEVRKDDTPILYSGPIDELPRSIAQLVQEGFVSSELPRQRVVTHYLFDGEFTKGWLHTHGMQEIGLPELEMRNVPSMFVEAAERLLKEVCAYMQRPDVVVRLGETMAVSDQTRFRFVKPAPIPGQEGHYEHERWQLAEIDSSCDACRLAQADQK
jgi:hypothetical protein